MPQRGRPTVNGERDRRIYAYVEVECNGLSLRRSYAKAAEQGGFGAMSARTVESAYVKERRRHAYVEVECNGLSLAAAACADCRRAQCTVPGRRAPDFSFIGA